MMGWGLTELEKDCFTILFFVFFCFCFFLDWILRVIDLFHFSIFHFYFPMHHQMWSIFVRRAIAGLECIDDFRDVIGSGHLATQTTAIKTNGIIVRVIRLCLDASFK